MWAQASDVLDSWIGDDAPLDTAKVAYWVGRAEREVLAQVPDLDNRISLGEFDPLVVRDVVVDMVTRVFRNPTNTRSTQLSKTTGQITETMAQTFGGDTPGGLFLSAAEKERLRGGATEGDDQTAFSVYPGGR